jgi:UDP-N-acetylglucosamine pyrophosphorylase
VKAPLYLISFWANTKVGILQNNHPSPNPLLIFEKLIAPDGLLFKLDPKQITNKIPEHPKQPHVYGLSTPLNQLLNFEKSLEKATKTLFHVKELYKLDVTDCQNPEISHIASLEEQDDHIIPIILAGGQGTRLKNPLPKALFEINGLSLIGHFCKKIKTASLKFQKPLKAFMIVSDDGFLPIQQHLKSHDYFGLTTDQLVLIEQKSLPFLNLQNQFVLNKDGVIQFGPSGNGEVFHLLKEKGFLDCACPQTCFEIIPIDNPLAPLFLKAHKEVIDKGYDVSILAIKDKSPNLGKIAKTPSGTQIIEYSEMQIDTLEIANTGLLCFSLAFAKKITDKPIHTYHVAHKKYGCLVQNELKETTIQKFESFIFDHLQKAKCHVLVADKKKIFQPLKTVDGVFGIEALKNALLETS